MISHLAKSVSVLMLSATLLSASHASHAQGFLGKVTHAVGGVISGTAHVITAPVTTVTDTAGKVLGGATQAATSSFNFLYQKAYSAASIAGKPGQFVFDAATFQMSLSNQLAGAAGNSVANALQGQSPLQVIGTPLAAGINAARERYLQDSRPIPADVKAGLAPYFSADVLNRARYAVGSVEITIPAVIGGGARFMSSDSRYAVTVNDIIVFNTPPPSFAEGRSWWAHEMTHVKQYAQMGVSQFAYEYVRTMGNTLEGEARSMEAIVGGQPLQAATVGLAPEYYVAQCLFMWSLAAGQLNPPLRVMVTSRGRVTATDMSGQSIQIGRSAPPRMAGAAWTLQTQNFVYNVYPSGAITWTNPSTSQAYIAGQVYGLR